MFSSPIIILEQNNHKISKVSIFLSTFTKEFKSEIVKKSQPMATHSGILAWRIPWTEEPGGLQSMGHKESDTTE